MNILVLAGMDRCILKDPQPLTVISHCALTSAQWWILSCCTPMLSQRHTEARLSPCIFFPLEEPNFFFSVVEDRN